MHKGFPQWIPHFKCYNRGCRKFPCLLNDACWFTMSALWMALLIAYSVSA